MIISDFTEPELQYFRDNCNFVNFEVTIFEKRAKGVPLEQIADEKVNILDYRVKSVGKGNRINKESCCY